MRECFLIYFLCSTAIPYGPLSSRTCRCNYKAALYTKKSHVKELPLSEVDGSCPTLPGKPQKGFSLWAGPRTPRPASPPHIQASRCCAFECCCHAMTCKTGQARFPIHETDTSCFYDDRLHGEILDAQLEYASCAATICPE